jgi:hypothetical protein
MSENSSQPQPSEEVDLGQLFKLIGNGFRNFFNFIGDILNKLFLAFVWLVFFAKKHFIIIALAVVVGVVLAVVKQKVEDPIYTSTIVIKQNYNTGEHLYNTLDYYNSLITEKDSTTLGEILKAKPSEASKIKEFEIESVLSENQKLKLFDEYTKGIDSSLATTIDFEEFIENSKDYEFQFQKITLKSKTKNNFEKTFTQIIDNIVSNAFFKNEQKKDLEELTRSENAIRESLKQSDSLQKVYQTVLIKSVETTTGSQTSVTIDNTEDKSVTKEFELYNSDLNLRRELVSLERAKENKEKIIEIISSQQDNGTLDNKGKLFGFEAPKIVAYGIKLGLLMFVILLLIEFVSFLDRYKDKV